MVMSVPKTRGRQFFSAACFAAILFVTNAEAANPEYRLTRCVAVGAHRFAASFESAYHQQRRISFRAERLSFGGDVKGEAKLDQVKELRLSPELEVVFADARNHALRFGSLTPACRAIVLRTAGQRIKVVE